MKKTIVLVTGLLLSFHVQAGSTTEEKRTREGMGAVQAKRVSNTFKSTSERTAKVAEEGVEGVGNTFKSTSERTAKVAEKLQKELKE